MKIQIKGSYANISRQKKPKSWQLLLFFSWIFEGDAQNHDSREQT